MILLNVAASSMATVELPIKAFLAAYIFHMQIVVCFPYLTCNSGGVLYWDPC